MNKKITYLFILFCSIASYTKAQNIQNTGFENWTNATYWEDPNGYQTSNPTSYALNGVANVTKTTDMHGGTYALRLETMNGTPGMCYIADISTGLSGGMPFSNHPDSVIGYAKYNLLGNDTAALVILFKKTGSVIGGLQKKVTGTNAGYVRFAAATNIPSIITPDTMIIFMVTSVNGNGTPGSYVQLDDVSFVGTNSGTFPNGTFENWTPYGFEECDHWWSSNIYTTSGGGNVSVDKSVSSHSGSFAAHLNTQYSALAQAPLTFLITARIDGNAHYTHELAAQGIVKMTGYYKYTPMANDSGEAVVMYTKYNSGTQMNDNVDSFNYKFTAAASYTFFQIPVGTLTGSPDSMWVGFTSSNLDGHDTSTIHIGSQLWIDDLDFVFPTGIVIPANEFFSKTVAFPNPSDGDVNITVQLSKAGNTSLHLYNAFGTEIRNEDLGNPEIGTFNFPVNFSGLPAGTYYYGIENNGKNEMHKLVISY